MPSSSTIKEELKMSKSRSVGTKLLINDVAVAGLKSISGVEVSADQTDVTDLGNQDGYKEYVAGFKDGGEVPVSGYMDGEDKGQEEIYKYLENGEVVDCEIRFPPKIGKSWYFKGIVTKFSTGVEVEDAVTFDASIKVSGKPSLEATKNAPAAG